MDRNPNEEKRVTYVIHSTRVIADDIRETLEAEGIDGVQIARNVSDIQTQAARLIIVDGHMTGLEKSKLLGNWTSAGVPILLLDGGPDLADQPAQIERLPVPFSSEDLVGALHRVLKI